MKLRALLYKDAVYMYEWMSSETVTAYFSKDFKYMTIDDCYYFIETARVDDKNIHYAICDDYDCYQGTISLKNIDFKYKQAEYAIVLRKSAMGTGLAGEATNEIFQIAFYNLGLERIYLCVRSKNVRAIGFYHKMGFYQTSRDYNDEVSEENLKWYEIKKETFMKGRKETDENSSRSTDETE